MDNLSVDFEIYSEAPLKDCGVYVYAKHPSTEILCASFRDDDQEEIWVPGRQLPDWVMYHIVMGGRLAAFNAAFERTIWSALGEKYDFPVVAFDQWECTMAQSAAMALPKSLSDVAFFLGLAQQKDAVGARVMNLLTKPDKKGKRTRGNAEQLQKLYAYCSQDTLVERLIGEVLPPLPDAERAVWLMDQEINDYGLHVDPELAAAAQAIWSDYEPVLNAEILEITNGYSTGTQVERLKEWITKEMGLKHPLHTLNKAMIVQLKEMQLPENVRRVLDIRSELGSAALKKFKKFRTAANSDNRIRGTLRYHGASTGRWAGYLIQPQNLIKPTIEMEYVPAAKTLVKRRDFEGVLAIFGSVSDTIGSLCRPTITAAPRHRLICADYNAIEARIMAWLADQDDLLEAFEQKKDPYVSMASRIYGKLVADINKQERFFGKSAVLGCFAGDTEVLTDSGWKIILDVQLTDKLWDGESWQSHSGVVYQGVQTVLSCHGLGATQDHIFYTKGVPETWATVANRLGLPSRKSKDRVYDILNVGPKHRFTIRSKEGLVFVVSNCGFGMGPDKFKADIKQKANVEISRDFAKQCVDTYRESNANIVAFWRHINKKVISCVRSKLAQKINEYLSCRVSVDHNNDIVWLYIRLPSGRELAYYKPYLAPGMFGEELRFIGVDGQTGKPRRDKLYGGLLSENCCQGIARDVMVDGMNQLRAAGYTVVCTVHDEVILEVPNGFGSVKSVEGIMSRRPSWAATLPLAVEGFENPFYWK